MSELPSGRSSRRGAAILGALGLIAALAGCGSAARTSPIGGVTARTISLQSPALTANRALPSRYACNTRAGLPPLKWGALPSTAAGLTVAVFELTEVQQTPQGTFRAKISAPRAVIANLSPRLHELSPGKLPGGAIAGPHRFAFCPARGSTGSYLIRVFATSAKLHAGAGFNEAAFMKKVIGLLTGVGSLTFHYRRA